MANHTIRMLVRGVTSPLRAKPDFLIVGAQKAGTSLLFYYVSQHRDVRRPIRKEIHYFDLKPHWGDLWYRTHFPHRDGTFLTGEASPYYLYHPLVPARIQRSYPDAKIIILLRHPVRRAVSQYGHSRRFGYEDLDIDAAFAAEEERLAGARDVVMSGVNSLTHQQHSYKNRSMYADQVERYLALFDRRQIFVAATETLLAEPESVMSDLFAFLDLKPFPDIDYEKRNVGNRQPAKLNDPVFEAACRADARRLDALTGQDFHRIWFGD